MKIGVLGGGQLGRMLGLAGIPLGMSFRFFDGEPGAPAAAVGELEVGRCDDRAALENFARGLDVVTYEFENVPVEAVRLLAQRVPVFPPPQALERGQDRLIEKQFFQALAIPTPGFFEVNSQRDLNDALRELGLPAVLKTRRFGYDGKGQAILRNEADAAVAWSQLGGRPLILEKFVPFEREASIISVRGRDGHIRFYPLVENEHRGGILRLSRAPAPEFTPGWQAQAESEARRVLQALDYVGVLAIELFQFNGRLLANEFAPRVHNSGHWTIEGAETSQFENHLRAIAGLPLGSTAPRGHAAMVNLIGEVPAAAEMLAFAGAHVHLYGKKPQPGRKLGHVTIRCDDARARDQAIADWNARFS